MPDSLKSKAVAGLFWSFTERIGQNGIQFVLSIVLARLILPEEFGQIAMLMVFTSIAGTIVDSGFGAALIQRKSASYVDECSVFYFNIAISILLAGLLCLAAPFIAAFYETPILEPLTRVLSLLLVIGALGMVQMTMLTKKLDFKTQMKIGIVATVLSGVIGVYMAYRGFGVWSLAVQSISRGIFRSVLLWVFQSWRPGWVFSMDSLRSMFPYGSKLLCATLVASVFDNLYFIVIGKAFSLQDLGFYSRAKGLQQIPVASIAHSVGRVTFPVFSSVQDDKPRMKRGVRKSLMILAFINFPMMVGLAVVAEPLVIVLFTDKWLAAVPYLQLMCFVGALHPLHGVNVNVLKAQGRADLNLKINVLKNGLKLVFLLITLPWGIEAILWGQIVLSGLCYFVNTHYTSILIKYPIGEQVRDLIPAFIVSVVMGGGVYALQYLSIPNVYMMLATQVCVGFSIYVFGCYVFKLSSFVEGMNVLIAKYPKLRKKGLF